jgi:tetraacyldisaccharide 4'-kinase
VTIELEASRPRSPWQRLYGAVLASRRRRLSARAERLPVPVVSIGNLHWGGGGKTPFTIAVARRLAAEGRRVAILSRGYRRASRGALVVSRGVGPEVGVAAAGDEPFLMAIEAAGVAVVVGERRAEAGRLALALDPAPELLLLDDGFSHVALARDVDLLLFPAADPFAGARLAPGGRLREPLAAAAAADAVVLTGAPAGDAAGGAALAAALAPFGFAGPGFASATWSGPPAGAGDRPLAPGTRVVAAAAIARPAAFFAAARATGLDLVAEIALPDHDPFAGATVAVLERRARAAGAEALLVTAKDRAKLAGRTALPLAVLPIEARPEPAFWTWLDQRLHGARP